LSPRAPQLGELNQRIELLKRATITESNGGQVTTYSSLGSTWAKLEWGAGGQSELGDADVTKLSAQITLRFRSDLEPGDRAIVADQQFDIDSIADINGRRAYLRCGCTTAQVTGSRYE